MDFRLRIGTVFLGKLVELPAQEILKRLGNTVIRDMV